MRSEMIKVKVNLKYLKENWQNFACTRKTWKSNVFIKCKFRCEMWKFVSCESLEISWKRVWKKCKCRKVINENFDTCNCVGDIEAWAGSWYA